MGNWGGRTTPPTPPGYGPGPIDERPIDERPIDERPIDERPIDERD